MHDAQDGPASSNPWIHSLHWEGRGRFTHAQRRVVRARHVEEPPHAVRTAGRAAGGDADFGLGSGAPEPLTLGRRAPQERPLSSGLAGDGPAPPAVSKQHGGPSEAVVAYWKAGGGLTHVVLTRAGHMTPRDDPDTTRWMLERWLAESVLASGRGPSGGPASALRRESGGHGTADA